ncbi:MinD superfamily P-loop ATPase [Desulfobotulus alkaliphilus]|uniref:MinD superfamily P-loop ATPase n=1 Tax=Desulfobotulus alkaliphilus TaxID=622671 RepID=A0A562S644_9BACT|nr:4Fe-4S binding protein [Desulfobotulus alkaliphilus]TWI76829.1 MinD superfamily P-loop ATPase [Desulfobotulus alkaliphilus]
MKILRDMIEIDEEKCDGCGLCIPSCAEGALALVDGKAKVIRDPLCDGLGACIGACPQGALSIVKKEAEPFDEEDVHQHLKSRGCPSSLPINLNPAPAPSGEPAPSALAQWPVQLRLIPPTAPFLRGADLLILADCSAVADPNLHRDLLPGKALLMTCPKLDNGEETIERLTAIFSHGDIRSVTAAIMEVPCCAGLSRMIQEAMKRSGRHNDLKEIIVQRSGKRGRPETAPKPPVFLKAF